MNYNAKEYITVAEASKRTRYTRKQINKLKEAKRIHYIKTETGKLLVNIIDIIKYSVAHPPKMLDTVWDEIDYIEGEAFYMLTGYDCKYFVSSKERIIDATTGQVLTAQLDDKAGYSSVGLLRCGKVVREYLHRLVAKTQCPNVLHKNIVHHIKISNPSIDRANNLIYVWKRQHDELHRLLKENNLKEYKKMINQIRKENSQKTYKIPHMDFESDDKYNYYMYVTSEGYKAYKANADIPFNTILEERAEAKK